jgi:hypothetical protein
MKQFLKKAVDKTKEITTKLLTKIKSIKFDKRYVIIGVAALLGAALIALAIFVFVSAFSPDPEWTTSAAGGDGGTVLSVYPDMSEESVAEHYGSASADAPAPPSEEQSKPDKSAPPITGGSSTSPNYSPHKQPPLDTPLDDISVTLYENGQASELSKSKLTRVRNALKKMFSATKYMPIETVSDSNIQAENIKRSTKCIEVVYNDRGDKLLIPASGKYKYYIFMYKNGEYQNGAGLARENNTIVSVINGL